MRNGKIAVIIGRFQVHRLSDIQLEQLNSVFNEYENTFIILGNSSIRNTINNPLDFVSRKTMIQSVFPKIEIYYINDTNSNKRWSENLDKLVKTITGTDRKVELLGSKHNFIDLYTGVYPTVCFDTNTFVSNAELRRSISSAYSHTEAYRAGVIAATATRFPTAYQTVDIALINPAKNEILLARKPNEILYQFPGGFSDPQTDSLEEDARREIIEETKLEVGEMYYIGSTKIADPRYRNEVDSIKTAFFAAKYVFGAPQACDDIAEVKWINIKNLTPDIMMPMHHVLLKMLNEKVLTNRTMQDVLFGNVVKTK
jgi:bifunctional NMN adenylyltransferase/nudix hydrolase